MQIKVRDFLQKKSLWNKKELLPLHLQKGLERGLRKADKNNAKIAQLVEHNLAKVGVAGSSPVFRSSLLKRRV